MSVTYRPAPAVARIAKPIISKHHRHLIGQRLEFVFRSEAERGGGRVVLGRARKVTGLNALLANFDDGVDDPLFVIEIAEDAWELLNEKQRRALVDHELCHLNVVENKHGDQVLKMRTHDVEEFGAVIARHGLWKPDLTRFVRAMGPEQLELLLETPPDDPAWLADEGAAS